ncbi:unnamed protein product [Protopolystoma xenopodis]|uniref:Uncharacterized protein n=1 Tax=Protopolystoma xenopodis TaxID=117903 RepID=A0A3S5AHM5_9PLAT|nr:unnamed protein product [Protopolystoma xenopodis]
MSTQLSDELLNLLDFGIVVRMEACSGEFYRRNRRRLLLREQSQIKCCRKPKRPLAKRNTSSASGGIYLRISPSHTSWP